MSELKEFKLGFDYIAKTFAGLEHVLSKELTEIGADDVEVIKRGAKFRGDTTILYKSNYLLRTAIRILKPIGVFEVKDDQQLYEKVRKINWMDVFNLDQTFNINAHVFNSALEHTQFVALKAKDAIVDQFREASGKRPWVAREDADIYIDVHISDDVCTISLDSSGGSLHKRGYRIDADKAPINEVLAAGMIKITGWSGDKDFYDPMCGSGTIPIEAAMNAMNIPAGYYREKFAFMNWEGFDAELWGKIKREANDNIKEIDCSIYASDRSKKAIEIAKRNLKNAALHKDINISAKYFDAINPEENTGILVFNPPYGNRLEERNEIRNLYQGIGDVLKQNFAGFEAWVITANMDEAKFIGLRTSAKIELYNGPLESRFLKFELYEGSNKEKKNTRRREREDNWKRERKDTTRKFDNSEERRPFKRSEKPKWKDADDKGSFRKRDERRPDNKSERPKWKDADDKDSYRKRDGDHFRKPGLGKPERTEYTGDGKKGSRKKRPRLK